MARKRETKSRSGWIPGFGLLKFFGIGSPFALAMWLASYLGFRPLADRLADLETPEGRAKAGVAAIEALRELKKHPLETSASSSADRGSGRSVAALEPAANADGVANARSEYDHFTDFEPLAPRPIEPLPPPANKKRTDFKGDFNPYR